MRRRRPKECLQAREKRDEAGDGQEVGVEAKMPPRFRAQWGERMEGVAKQDG
jgi:hypothetical protein